MSERGRERLAAWGLFLAGFGFILATLDLAYAVSSFLRPRGFMWPTVMLLSSCAGAAVAYLLYFGAGLRTLRPWLSAAPLLAVYLVAMVKMRSAPAERFHFVEYGLLHLLALRAAAVDLRGAAAYAVAAAATACASVLDEVAQGYATATRRFDREDVRMNLVAVILSGFVFAALFGRDIARARFPELARPESE